MFRKRKIYDYSGLVERIFVRFDVKNYKSGNLLQKIGMKKEGVLRYLAKNPKGEWKDRAHYSILKEEYENWDK